MATNNYYLGPNDIKVYPAVNSPNDGDINTEYNAKTLAKSSSSRNCILSGFNFITSSTNNTFKLGINTNDSCIRGSLLIDGYYVEIFENLEFTLQPTSGSNAVIVFAIPHYAENTNTDRVKWEKSQHLTGVENGQFLGIRFEAFDALTVGSGTGDYIYNPTKYSYTDDTGNNLPSNALVVGLVGYDSSTSKYTDNYMPYALWQYSKINAEDVALPNITDEYGEHRDSSIIPLQVDTSTTKYPHTLAEYFKDVNNVYVLKNVDDTKYGKLSFKKNSSSSRHSFIQCNDNQLNIDVDNTTNKLVNVNGDLTATRVFNAVYNDYAELYRKDDTDENISPGDVIELNPETGNYRKCKTAKSKLVVGICSDSYGYIVGGELGTIEDNLISYIPVGISGRVYANTDDETCEPGDLVMSTNEGKVATYKNVVTKVNGVLDDDKTGRVLGKCLSKTKDGKVLIQIMLG